MSSSSALLSSSLTSATKPSSSGSSSAWNTYINSPAVSDKHCPYHIRNCSIGAVLIQAWHYPLYSPPLPHTVCKIRHEAVPYFQTHRQSRRDPPRPAERLHLHLKCYMGCTLTAQPWWYMWSQTKTSSPGCSSSCDGGHTTAGRRIASTSFMSLVSVRNTSRAV